jgi:uncharacterized protein YceH (UPF0502 family)
LVAELPRLPGARENRWAHLLSGAPRQEPQAKQEPQADVPPAEVAALKANVERLEAEVVELKAIVERIRTQLGMG